MSNEAKGPYTVVQDAESRQFVVKTPLGKCLYWSEYPGDCHRMAEQINVVHHSALTSQAARVRELEEDREWLRSQWERHRRALNAIAWGEYDNVAFCRRLAQDELAIGVKVANDRAAATVAALTPKEAT